jgi:hypothetical protein
MAEDRDGTVEFLRAEPVLGGQFRGEIAADHAASPLASGTASPEPRRFHTPKR